MGAVLFLALGAVAELTPGEPVTAPMKCPGAALAPPFGYAWAHVVVDFDEDCDTVRKEIEARAKMEDGWKDPHNGGKYDLNKKSGDVIITDHYTGNAPHFHDKQMIVLVAGSRRKFDFMVRTGRLHKSAEMASAGGCMLYGCSDSQGVSAADGSTNYCNLHNLYANEDQDKVPPVHTNLKYKEEKKSSQLGALDLQVKACNTMKKEAVEKPKEVDGKPGEPYKAPMKCPGSKAPPGAYAWSHVIVEFDEDCDTVKEEIEARARMDGQWQDPHNGGKYELNSATNGNDIMTDHYTGNYPHFHDQQEIVLVEGSQSKLEDMVAKGLLEMTAELSQAGGCTLYGCSNSQGISAADGSTNYCNMHNLYANEAKDKVKPVNTNLNYKEKKKTSQLGALDTDVRNCNTMKATLEEAEHTVDAEAEQAAKARRDGVVVPVAVEGRPGEPYKAPMKCPGSKAPDFAYAWAHVVVDIDQDCATVRKEIEARAKMEDGWKDPHNGGKYDLNKASGDVIITDHYTGAAPHFHDKQMIVLEANGSGCTLYGCSDSQGVSAADGSTNYCNLHNLYANEKNDKVEAVHTELTYKEKKKTSQLGALDTDVRQCNTMKKTEDKVDSTPKHPSEPYKAPMKCPGSKAPDFAYAWAHVVVDIDESCDTVRKEIEARAKMEGGWKDPHNGGKYDLNKDSGDVIITDHYTGNAPHFHDKQMIVLQANGSGCTLYGCSDSQGVSAADGSTNYCNLHNLYANEAKDKVEAVNTNLTYKEKKKTSQLGALDTDVRQCNTMKQQRDAAAAPVDKKGDKEEKDGKKLLDRIDRLIHHGGAKSATF